MAPRFKLNILWLENELGIAIDQIQSGEQIPLTDYFFWPKSDTWDQIRRELETKPESKNVRINRNFGQVDLFGWQKLFGSNRCRQNECHIEEHA